MATITSTPQDTIVGDPLEHLKAIVTEVTLQRATGTKDFFENLVTDTTEVPVAPTNVACTQIHSSVIHITQIEVSWTDNTGGSLPHRVHVREMGDTNWVLWTPTGVSAGTTLFVVKPLNPHFVYQFMVRSWNQTSGEESPLSNIVTCDITLNTSRIYRINETILAA